MTKLSKLCQFNGGCIGCCGHGFGSKEEIKEAIRKNTLEFMRMVGEGSEENLVKFRERAEKADLREGVCRNLVEVGGKIFCPLHPSRNEGKDLREGHCDVDHLCETAKEFSGWDEGKQGRFLRFVEGKEMDSLDYSIRMDGGSLLRDFKENELS